MKERPILFSDEMVRALLDGRKTQTRRALKGQPPEGCGAIEGPEMFAPTVYVRGEEQPGPEVFGAFSEDGEWSIRCPYGQPGDRLWVREAHAFVPEPAYRRSTGICQQTNPSDDYQACVYRENFDRARSFPWRPSIHMPRWASRILLEVTDVRVERLQEISEADALAEGIWWHESQYQALPSGWRSDISRDVFCSAPRAFKEIWAHINGAESVVQNPWVWVVKFRVIEPAEVAQ